MTPAYIIGKCSLCEGFVCLIVGRQGTPNQVQCCSCKATYEGPELPIVNMKKPLPFGSGVVSCPPSRGAKVRC